LIDPSGVFDVDEFFDIIHEETLDRLYEIANVLTLVDATLEDGLSAEADYLLASQVAHAGKIILTHVDEVTKEEISGVLTHICTALQQIKCDRKIQTESEVTALPWENWSDAEFDGIVNAGYVRSSFEKKYSMDSNHFTSLFFMNPLLTKGEVLERIRALFAAVDVGNVLRVKGFLKDVDGKWCEVNATKRGITVEEIKEGQEIVIVIGEQLQEEKIISYFPAKYSTNKEGQIY
jgi:G3E family GTPase